MFLRYDRCGRTASIRNVDEGKEYTINGARSELGIVEAQRYRGGGMVPGGRRAKPVGYVGVSVPSGEIRRPGAQDASGDGAGK